MDHGWQWAELVAAAFGLGAPTAPLVPVTGGVSHQLFRLDATGGRFAVKRLRTVSEPWWWSGYRAAAEIERSAAACGVRMPERRRPWVVALDLDGVRHFWQAHEWCDGHQPTGPVDALSDWTGRTLALLHRRPAGDLTTEPRPYPLEAWHEWLGDDDTGIARHVRRMLPVVAEALAAVSRPGPSLTPVATHRDIKPDNVLMTGSGPVLLDWDSSGRDTAEEELVRTALAMGFESERPFRRVVAAYRQAGGAVPPADPGLFQGVVTAQLRTAEWLLWRALGHRGDDDESRRHAAVECLARLRGVKKSLRLIPCWTGWLTTSR